MLRFLVVFSLLISLGLGCNADDPLIPKDVTYPGAPVISIRKTSDDPLILRLEAKEPLPYDIEVRLEGLGTFSDLPKDFDLVKKDPPGQIRRGRRVGMQMGRQVLGIKHYRNDFRLSVTSTGPDPDKRYFPHSVTYSILEWEGIGDAPYNVGNPHTVTVKVNQE